MLSLGTTALLSAPLASTLYYYNIYIKEAENYNNSGTYNPDEARRIQENVYSGMDYIFYGLLTGGIVINLAVWIASIIDGVHTYKKITKPSSAKGHNIPVNVKFEFRGGI